LEQTVNQWNVTGGVINTPPETKTGFSPAFSGNAAFDKIECLRKGPLTGVFVNSGAVNGL